MTPSDSRPVHRQRDGGVASAGRVSPDYPQCHSSVPCPLPRRAGTGARVDCFPIPHGLPLSVEGSAPATYRFEACSGFTRVTAHWIARPSKTAFVTRLRRGQLPGHAARQLPSQSTTPWMEPSSIDTPRLRGALPNPVDYFPLPCSGHQWKSVLARIVSCCPVRATQRWLTTCSRSSMASK